MKVLTIGSDRKLFEKNSAVLSRNIEYAKKTQECHTIVFTLCCSGFENKNHGNLFLYPTNSKSRLHYIFDAYKIGKKILRNKNFIPGDSVISCQDPFEAGFVGYFLKRKFDFPLQLQIHTDFLSGHFRNSFLNVIRYCMARFVLPRADGLRVVSEEVKQSISRRFPKLSGEIDVLPVFVDIAEIENKPATIDLKEKFSQFNFTIFMASRLSREKRIDVALRAIKKVVSEFSHVGLLIAGSGEEASGLEKMAGNLGISKNVVFLGWQDDLVSYYKTANLFLVTSEYEGYGMTLVEASASGCPIVSTDVGIAGELLATGGGIYVCPVGDVECIYKRIAELIKDNAKRELFKHQTKDSIRRLFISKDEYIDKYASLLQKTASLHTL